MLELQRNIHANVVTGDLPDTWLIVEHDPVITLGRNANPNNVLLDARTLATRGIEIMPIERGGDVAYHGPGQLVVYPIVKLARFREIVPFVSALENAVVDALATFGIAAGTRREHRGVYVGDAAICTIGLAVKQMTSIHGLALNVSTNLNYNQLILPCGMLTFQITSMSQELGRTPTLKEGQEALIAALERRFAIIFSRSTHGYRRES